MKLRNSTADIQTNQTTEETAILQNLDLVDNVARYLRQRLPPCVTLDDLIGAGTIGLITAARRFDDQRGVNFRAYAKQRVTGAMLDYLREADPLSRAERRRARAESEHLGASGFGATPITVTLDETHLRRLPAPNSTLFALRAELRVARHCLSARENRVITLLFDLGMASPRCGNGTSRQR